MVVGGLKAFGIALLFFLGGCTSQDATEVPQPEPAPQPSKEEIKLRVDGWKPMTESRAALYESGEDLCNHESPRLPGGSFTLNGYLDGKGTAFLGGAQAYWWIEEGQTSEWCFVSGGGKITYYWPNSDAVNFFAYMPYKGYTGDMKHYVSNVRYTEAEGAMFDCALPETNADDANQVEFIYAYETEKTKADNPLTLHFKHPFAAVYFQLSPESSRMTIGSITLKDLYLTGTFKVSTSDNGAWTSTGTPSNYTAAIDKRIPNDVNYNTPFAGPFLVMPQELGNQVKLTLNGKRDETNPINGTANLTGKWESGKKYIYTLKVGERNEEIYFNVAVEDWIVVSHKNEINVE